MKEQRFFARLSVGLRAVLCVLLLPALLCSGARAVQQTPLLDAALSMLEKGNPFLESYNDLTGAGIEAYCEYGCPYFFGGSDIAWVGSIRECTQNSRYYRTGCWYPGGFDCSGFTKWVMKTAGRREHPSLSTLLTMGECAVPVPEGTDAGSVAASLEAGDLLVLLHEGGGYHVLMYIGTLLDYGYHPEWLPEKLKDKAGYPLVIHCSGNEDYSRRYTQWVFDFPGEAVTTDGGVMVSLLDCSAEGCDGTLMNLDGTSSPYFTLDGYHLTVYTSSVGQAARRWIRWK